MITLNGFCRVGPDNRYVRAEALEADSMIRSVYTSPDQVVVTFAAERGASFLYSSLMITATEAERLADLLRSAASYAKGGDGR